MIFVLNFSNRVLFGVLLYCLNYYYFPLLFSDLLLNLTLNRWLYDCFLFFTVSVWLLCTGDNNMSIYLFKVFYYMPYIYVVLPWSYLYFLFFLYFFLYWFLFVVIFFMFGYFCCLFIHCIKGPFLIYACIFLLLVQLLFVLYVLYLTFISKYYYPRLKKKLIF